MSNENNEADALFATRRKKQQDEEAQREAQRLEQEKLEELERQRKAMAEDIKRLETLQAEQKAQAEQNALEAQKAREAQEALLAAQAAQKAAQKEAQKAAKEAKKAAGGESPLKKYLPFILIGVGVIVVVVVILICVKAFSKDKVNEDESYPYSLADDCEMCEWNRVQDDNLGTSFVYPSFFENDSWETMPDVGKYTYYYFDKDYSKQKIVLTVYLNTNDYEDGSMSEDDALDIIATFMEKENAHGYKTGWEEVTYLWRGVKEFDDSEDSLIAVYADTKENFEVVIELTATKESSGQKRYADAADLEYIAQVVFNSIAVG